MKTRKLGAAIFAIATLIVIGYTIYKILMGISVGFQEVITIGLLVMMFLSAITWGSKEDKDGIYMDDELGQKITEKSSKISYYILVFAILAAVAADQFVNGTVNIFLLAILGLAMIILPLAEFCVAKKYQ